jgi:hypothetical protein
MHGSIVPIVVVVVVVEVVTGVVTGVTEAVVVVDVDAALRGVDARLPLPSMSMIRLPFLPWLNKKGYGL